MIHTVTTKKGLKFASKCYSVKSNFMYKVLPRMYYNVFQDSKWANKLFLFLLIALFVVTLSSLNLDFY